MENTLASMPFHHVTQSISRCILSGILLEVACEPSPGLVSPFSMGSHDDMNHYSFMLSTAAIAPMIEACACQGCQDDSGKDLLSKLRPLGMEAEKVMLEATGGVNTHKGMIFLGGITAAAAGVVARRNWEITSKMETAATIESDAVCGEVAAICRGIVSRELEAFDASGRKKPTQGEHWYRKAGIRGIRGEVEEGLPAVRLAGLPVFEETLGQHSLKTAMVHTLLHLMMVVEDTTVLARSGLEGLNLLRSAAAEVIGLGGIITEDGRQAMNRISKTFEKKGISPGGSADLLAITIALWMMENGPIPAEKTIS